MLKDKKTESLSIFFIVEFILCFLMVFGVLWNKPDIASNAFLVSFVTLVVEFVIVSFQIKELKMFWLVMLIIAVSAVGVIMSFYRNNAEFEFDKFKEYFIFLSAIIFMFVCCHIKTDKRTVNFILKFNIVIACLYIAAYRYAPRVNNSSVGIDFNFGNPNFAGMWILQSLIYCTIAVVVYKKVLMKIIAGIPLVMLIYYLHQTGARNCELAYLIFLAVCILFMTGKSKSFPKPVMVFINVLPIVFVPLYLKFIDPIVKTGWLDFIVSEGKSLNSRVKVWNHFFEKLGSHWLEGEYLTCLGNSHNSHMVVLCSYGAVTLLLVILFTYLVSVKASENNTDKRNGYCLAGFFATLFMGFGEGALFAGGIGLYIMGCSFIYLARYDFSDFDAIDGKENDIVHKRFLDFGLKTKRGI